MEIDAAGCCQHITNAFEKLGSRLVDEFRKLAANSEMQTEQLICANALLDERMSAVEKRISALERKPE
jgi:hypothetical protein